jgi:hypothetical protein
MVNKKVEYAKVRFELANVVDSSCLVIRYFSSDTSYLAKISAFCHRFYWTKNVISRDDYIAVYLASEVQEDTANAILNIIGNEFNETMDINMERS